MLALGEWKMRPRGQAEPPEDLTDAYMEMDDGAPPPAGPSFEPHNEKLIHQDFYNGFLLSPLFFPLHLSALTLADFGNIFEDAEEKK